MRLCARVDFVFARLTKPLAARNSLHSMASRRKAEPGSSDRTQVSCNAYEHRRRRRTMLIRRRPSAELLDLLLLSLCQAACAGTNLSRLQSLPSPLRRVERTTTGRSRAADGERRSSPATGGSRRRAGPRKFCSRGRARGRLGHRVVHGRHGRGYARARPAIRTRRRRLCRATS